MKPVDFSYQHPDTVSEAVAALSGHSASVVSGNQSLGPMINLRLARPKALIDVSRIETLRQAEPTDTGVRFGAAVTHADIEDGLAPDPTGGWMQSVAGNIAYRAVRNRGTIGGSLCHADPAADWVTVLPALCATVTITRANGGTRQMDAIDFVTGPYSTALQQGEILTAIDVPRPSKSARWGYWKYVRQVGEFAKASAAVLSDPEQGRTRLIVGALGRKPLMIDAAEAVIEGSIDGAAALKSALGESEARVLRLHAVAINRAVEQLTITNGQ